MTWRVGMVGLALVAGPLAAQEPVPSGVERARADSVRYPWTRADVDFMSRMIAHHAQAVVMSKMAPTHGASEQVLRLAERIVRAQEDEIGLMQRWLRDRLQPVPSATADTAHAHGGHGHEMPGMLTAEQLASLHAARGAEFDRMFLRLMIQHHQGAIRMVRELFATPGAGQDEAVFRFASDVHVDQVTEVQRMQKLLASLALGVPIH